MATVTAHFTTIKATIIEELRKAAHSVQIAVAWFTDEELMAELMDIRFRHRQLAIQVIISNSAENFHNPRNLKKLVKSGIELRVMRENAQFLHHKFCLIDDRTIINGSYNWTYYAAHKNEENITIIRTEEGDVIFTQFKAKFNNYCNKECSFLYESELSLPTASHTLLEYDAEQIDLRRRFQERVIENLSDIEQLNLTRPGRERIREDLIYDMIKRYGDGVMMVKKLLRDEQIRDDTGRLQPKSGFIKLVDWGRQNDLSFESLVLDSEFESLFTGEEKRTCRQLLNQG